LSRSWRSWSYDRCNIAVVACARYDFALPLARDEAEARDLMALCLRVLLLVVAYFGIRKYDTGGRLPERRAKSDAELAARFAADMKEAVERIGNWLRKR